MKKALVFVLAAIMVFTVLSATVVYAGETAEITYSDHLTENSDTGYDYDITGASIAWVKQAKGALIWVPGDDSRSDDEIIAQAKDADSSLTSGTDSFAVFRGLGYAQTPNETGSKADVTVSDYDGETVMSIEGKYSHFVFGSAVNDGSDEPATEATTAVEPEKVNIRIDAPLKMAVAFEDGTVYYGGEMKEVEVGKEYLFQMCSVNWENGTYDGNENGLAGTVVYRMKVVHQDDFLALAREAKADPDRYVVKGMDIIDTVNKTITVNCDAEDAHLETDVNSFFMAYRFHFTNDEYDHKTGIEKVVNTPLESLSVNLPLGSTITCNAYYGSDVLGNDNVFITNNSGEGTYDDEYLTSVNDYTWAY